MTFEEWRDQAAKYADEELSILEFIWSKYDPYDLFEAAQAAFDSGQYPEAFIREMFEEDIVGQAYNKHLVEESERSNENQSIE
jgi:hypothetical protein